MQYNGIMGENNAFVLHFVHHGNALFLSQNQTCFSIQFSYNTLHKCLDTMTSVVTVWFDKIDNEKAYLYLLERQKNEPKILPKRWQCEFLGFLGFLGFFNLLVQILAKDWKEI